MGGVANGIAYHGGFLPYVGTFLTFSDYMRGAGAAGRAQRPQHRSTSGRTTPSGSARTARPTSRSSTTRRCGRSPTCGSSGRATRTRRWPHGRSPWSGTSTTVGPGGAVADPPEAADPRGHGREGARGPPPRGLRPARGQGRHARIILIGTGSELQLAFGAAEALEADGIAARVVSLPCWERFEAQDAAYRESVLPRAVRARVSVEAGVSLGWDRWVGDEGAIVGLDHFGASAPAGTIFEKFGFTVDRVVDVARGVLAGSVRGRSRRWRPATCRLRGAGIRRSPAATPVSAGPRRPTPATAEPPRARCLRRRPRRGRPQGRPARRRLDAAGLGHETIDLGGDGSDPLDDYPDFAARLGYAVRDGEADRGVLICGSGVGASVAANKIRGIRTAVCHDTYSAHQGVEHDDMNILTLGSRVIGPEPAWECVVAFLGATFSGEPRHQRRLDKVLAIEAEG